MKKIKLLLAAFAATVGLSVNAQSWTSPGSDPVSGQSYYILNVGAGQFVTAANDWGTQMSATGTDTGLLIRTDQVNDVTVGGKSLSGWEFVNTNNANKLLFRDSERWGYTDKGTQNKGYVWNVTKVNGVYRLQTAAGDPAYPAASTQYAGANASLNGARVYFGYNSSSNDIDWIFLTEAQKGTANIVAKARLYRALMKAYAAGVDTEEASAVYENSSSTADQLNTAVTALNNACLAAHLDNASDADPRDITEFVLNNSDFTQGNINGWETNYVSGTQATNIGYQDNNTYQSANGFVSKFIEAWRSGNAKIGDGYLRQTVSDMPEGKYVLECDAIATNQGNTSATTTGALLFINADGVDFTASLSTNGSAVQHFSTEFLFSGEGDVIFGLKTQNTTANWIAADNFKVTYYGIDLSAYVTQLNAAVSAFEALEGTVPSATYNDKKTSVLDVYNKAWESSKEYSTAISAIQTATSQLSSLAAAYAEYNTIRAAVLAAYASTDVTAADNAANSASSVEDITAAIATVRTALKTAIATNNPENINLTAALLINPSFETGDFTGWSNNGMAVQGNESFGKVGAYYAECWTPDGTKSITQELTEMPAGVYKATATIKARGVSSANLSAGGVSKAMTIGDEQNTYIVEFACDANANVIIKFEGVGTKANSSWLCADNFTLTYVGSLPELTAIEGKMNAEVAAAQTSAVNTYNSDKTVANYNAASAAIAAAQSSVAAYAVAATALGNANALMTAHNFASEAAATTFADAIAAVQTNYEAGTLTNDEANAGGNLGTIVTGWHEGNNTSAAVYLRDGFALGSDFAADPALHVNTWSTEGDNDGTGFSVPFYESWTSAASLPEENLTGTISDLPNGLYSVTAWVRKSSASDDAGITMNVNGGETVEIVGGDHVGNFFLKEYTAEGLVKQGTLTLSFNVAAESNVSWLSFKNIKYTKVRDLTPEEAAVVPTAIALDETEVALDATTTSKTFTLTFTPENATKTVTWTSSDASVATVADGVVTAVSSGTTTITVKSTLDENVSASATVTVSFPETEVAAYTNDGATRYVHHYGENIIKNGTFQYPNPFQGWKSGANGNCDANNFNIVTEDENKYIQAKQSMGAGDSHSISTGWPIEAGKTYVFGYKVKASKAGTLQFLVTSLTNSIGTETAQLDTENERKAKSVTTSWTDVKYEFTNSDNYAFVQFRARWMADSQSFDDFYLVEKTADDDVIGNVQYALDAIPNSNIGTGAFQYSQDAIDNANALVQGVATVEDVENAYNALKTLNAPEEGTLYNIVVAEESNAKKGNALVIVPGATTANNPSGYGLNVNLAPNTNLNQAVKFTKESGNNYYVSFETAAGTTYLTTGSLNGSAAGWKTQQIQATTDAEKKCAFTIVASNVDNVFYIYNPEHKDYIDYQNGGSLYTDTDIDHKSFSLVETTKPSITINTTAAGWGTTMLPFAVAELPEGVKAYTCTGVNKTLTLEEVEALEANKPYIIEGNWKETLTGDAQGTALTYGNGILTGVYEATPAPVGSYVLQNNNNKVGFYRVEAGAEPTVGANRAYLTVPAGVKADAFFFDEGTATAIKSVFDGVAAGEVYDLAGRKLQKLQKGVNIVNGKKVLVK